MMNNFFDFIKEDIEAKKILLSSMPLNNKTNIKKYNEKIESIISSYMDYKENLEKYLIAKKDSFKYQIQSNNDEVLEKVCKELSYVRCMLNPLNTYVEKMGLDSLLFDITNYSSFDFEKLNQIIGKIIDKFNIAGIPLVSNDFDYTSYVNEYMTSFLEIRSTKSNYEELEEVFEKIYWFNPEIIEHIELCFRKLIKKYSKQFEEYILKTQKEMLEKYDISDYEDCKKKLKEVYNKIEVIKEEDIDDIVDQAKSGKIEINNYFENSKVRETAYSTLCLEPLDFNNKVVVDKFYDSIFRLKTNLIEYKNYLKFQPLFDDFKNEYEKISINLEKINKIQTEINQKESKLESINKKLSNKEDSKPVLFFMKKKNENPKDLKIESVKLAKELYDLYHSLEEENFKKQISNLMSDSLLISDVIRIYRSYDYFKKLALKKVFNLEKYDEVISTSEEFDLFAKNPNNIIVNGIYAFEENDTHKNLINKYRFENINLEDTTLDEESIEILINKIDFILRIKKIEESSLSIEKIWFIVMVNKLIG